MRLRLFLLIMLSSLFMLVTKTSAKQCVLFPDVVKDSWYEESVMVLSEMGIIDGFPDGTFRPDMNIRADEFIKLIVSASGYEKSDACGYWARQYIDEALKAGMLFKGEISDYTREINRGEMSRIIVRALGMENEGQYDDYQGNIGDWTEIGPRYLDHVLTGYAAGIIEGIEGRFVPLKGCTRKEACVMVHRLIDEDMRLVSVPGGIICARATADIICRKLEDAGYMTLSEWRKNETLTRERMAGIIFDAISLNEKLSQSIIPEEETVIPAISFGSGGAALSETYKRICSLTRTVEQNFSAMQIYEITRKYRDGRTDTVLSLNLYKDREAYLCAPRNIEGMKAASLLEPKMKHDHERFGEFFSDSARIEDEYRTALFRLYDWGILNLCSFSEYSMKAYCCPKAAVWMDEIDEVIKRLADPSKRKAVDEKAFGIGDSWGIDLYGSDIYRFRLSEIKMLCLYDRLASAAPSMTRVVPGDTGMEMAVVTSDYPFYDDLIVISDDCGEGRFNHYETAALEDFRRYDIVKYEAFVPAAYADKYLDEVRRFIESSGVSDFSRIYGAFEIDIRKTGSSGNDTVEFRYAYREVD